MKRIMAMLLAFAALLSLCAACGSKEVADDAYAGVADELMAGTSDHTAQFAEGAAQTQTEAQTSAQDSQTAGEGTAQTQPETAPETDPEAAADEEAAGEDTPAVVEDPEPQEPAIIHPLTGEESATDYAAFRPYAVMIDNGREALPQDGISYADVLYEVTTYPGGATRCMAIYQDMSVVDIIGGIRSCRSQFVDIALSYDAIYLHFGGSDEGKARINKVGCDHVDGMSSSWFYRHEWRANHIGYVHSVVVDVNKLLENIEGKGYRIRHEEGFDNGLVFGGADMTAGQDALKATVCIGGSKTTDFEYNEETGLYMASQYGKAWVDRTNEQQLGFTNLIFIRMESRSSGEYQLHETTGSGNGYYMTGGKVVEITWTRESLEEPYRYFLADGTPLGLQAGKTYIGIYTDGGWVEWEGPTAEGEAAADEAAQ